MQLVNSPHSVLTECRGHKTVEIWFCALSARLYRIAKFLLTRHGIADELSETALLHDAYVPIASRTALTFVNEAVGLVSTALIV